MGSIPAFHAQAAKEAASRMTDAVSERDRASSFLEQLDELLIEAIGATSSQD